MSTEEIVELEDETGTDKPGAINQVLPARKSVNTLLYSLDDKFRFNCHKGISCFNKCCKSINVQLTPYDILRLKKHLDISSRDFISRYTLPVQMDAYGTPGLLLSHKPGTSECIFVTEQGCSVYTDRPTACRYYALGNVGVRKKAGSKTINNYVVVVDNYCLGHNETKTQTIRQYLHEQGAAHYDQYNEDWLDIIRKRSNSTRIGKAGERSMQLFDMCSYDIDSFREYIQGSGFLNLFDIDQNTMDALINNDEELLLFAMRFLKQILFGEKSIHLKQESVKEHTEVKPEIRIKKFNTKSTTHSSAQAVENSVDS